MIEADPAITVVNKDLVLATLTEDVNFEMTLTVGKGRGYVTAAEHLAEEGDEHELGVIAVDSLYSPVSRVRYATEDARVGQKTGLRPPAPRDLDQRHDHARRWRWSRPARSSASTSTRSCSTSSSAPTSPATTRSTRCATRKADDRPELEQKLDMTVQELDLSVRANNCLESAKIGTVRDLVKKTDADLLKVRSFGKTSLREVKRKLADLGLSLGMDLDRRRRRPVCGVHQRGRRWRRRTD
jgi:DNA-directed RNA polymerase subunit alpha